jgi:hypothetical protein
MSNPMVVPCHDWQEKLAATGSDDLSPDEHEALTQHVLSCSACATVLTEYQEMDALLKHSLTLHHPLELPKDFAIERRQRGGAERDGRYTTSPSLQKKDLQRFTRLWENQSQHEPADSTTTRKTRVKSTRGTRSSVQRPSLALAGDVSANYPSYTIRIFAQCLSKYTEVLPDERLNTEVLVEVHVGQILLSLFEVVTIEDVNLHFFPGSLRDQQLCFLQVNTQCHNDFPSLSPQALQGLELTIEDAISGILSELLGTIIIEEVRISPLFAKAAS